MEAESNATSVRLSQSDPSSSAAGQLYVVRPGAACIGGKDPGQKLKKADNVVQRLRPSMALKRAKREPNGDWVCADSVS